MKLTKHIITGLWVLIMTLLTLSVQGQEAVTKSGTPVRPADRMPAQFANQTKSPSTLTDPTAGTYLVVTHPDLLESLRPLLQWRQQQGYRVETLCIQTYQRDSIHSRLLQRYQTASTIRPAQRYVLLVGDVDRIQAFAEQHTPSGLNTRATDMYYGEYTGDYLPEAYVGRLSVADNNELASVVAKIIAYEQGLWATAAHHLLFAAGSESRTPAPTTTNGQVNYLSQLAAQGRPELDTVCFRNPISNEQINNLIHALSQGNALVNYTAHCNINGWENPNITFNSLDTLNNTVPTLFVNNCCRSNAFDGTCFGEHLLRRPTGGAVGVIGATNETLWAEDYYWAVGAKYPPTLMPTFDSLRPGAFDSLMVRDDTTAFDHNNYTLGAMLHAGCRAVSMAGSPYDAFYWETYCLLGDPATTPLPSHVDSLWWILPDSLTAGSTTLTIACSPFARISATCNTQLLATTISGADGTARLTMNQALHSDSLTLTATRSGAIPLVTTRPIALPEEARLATTEYHLEENRLHITVKNVGRQAARAHRLHLIQDSNDRAAGATFDTMAPVALTSLASQSDTVIVLGLSNMSIGNEPLASFRLVTTDSMGYAYDTLHIVLPTEDLRPKIVSLTLLDTLGNPTRALLPGHRYLLEASLSHPADSVTLTTEHQSTSVEEAERWQLSFAVAEGAERMQITISAHKDRWQHRREGWLNTHNTWERFETGDFANLPWQQSELYPWRIDSTVAHEGHYCARSATIGDAQKSTLELMVETLADDSVSFYFMVSSEAHDWLYFYIDGRRVGYWSGNSGWRRHVRPLPAGKHRLQWVYQKDAALSERNDCAYIDDLRLPAAIWRQPYGTSELDSMEMSIGAVAEELVCKVYPNPTKGRVNIELGCCSHVRHIELFDRCGRLVDKIFIPADCTFTQYFATPLRFGVYTLVLHAPTGSHVEKLIVTK